MQPIWGSQLGKIAEDLLSATVGGVALKGSCVKGLVPWMALLEGCETLKSWGLWNVLMSLGCVHEAPPGT